MQIRGFRSRLRSPYIGSAAEQPCRTLAISMFQACRELPHMVLKLDSVPAGAQRLLPADAVRNVPDHVRDVPHKTDLLQEVIHVHVSVGPV